MLSKSHLACVVVRKKSKESGVSIHYEYTRNEAREEAAFSRMRLFLGLFPVVLFSYLLFFRIFYCITHNEKVRSEET